MNAYKIAFYGYEYKILRIVSIFWLKVNNWNIEINKVLFDDTAVYMYIEANEDVAVSEIRDIIDVILSEEQIVVGYTIHEV